MICSIILALERMWNVGVLSSKARDETSLYIFHFSQEIDTTPEIGVTRFAWEMKNRPLDKLETKKKYTYNINQRYVYQFLFLFQLSFTNLSNSIPVMPIKYGNSQQHMCAILYF